MWNSSLNEDVRDTLVLANISSGSCSEEAISEQTEIYELRILRRDNEDRTAGYTEYLTNDLIGGNQSLGGQDYQAPAWDNRFPFNRIRPCWVRNDGFVEAYLKRDDLSIVEEFVPGTKLTLQDKDYLNRTDGNIMVEFPNLYYNAYPEDEDWFVIQISHKKVLPHWSATNQRIYNSIPASGEYTYDDITKGYTVIHDTIYFGIFYSEKIDRHIDGKTYSYFNSNAIKKEYLPKGNSLDASEYTIGIQSISKDFDVFSVQNIILLKLLQIFRFCSTDNPVIANTIHGESNSIPKNITGHPYQYEKRFAGLDYPFGFGISFGSSVTDWEMSSNIPGFKSSTVYMPAILGSYYRDKGQSATSFIGSYSINNPTNVPPFEHSEEIDKQLGSINLYEDTGGSTNLHQLSRIDGYESSTGWNKPCQVLSETEKRTPDEIISELILSRCESREIDPRMIEALEAQMADINAGGRTCDWDEVAAWMDSWFTDHEKPEPQCRY